MNCEIFRCSKNKDVPFTFSETPWRTAAVVVTAVGTNILDSILETILSPSIWTPTQNTSNYTTQRHTIGPAMVITWDPHHHTTLLGFGAFPEGFNMCVYEIQIIETWSDKNLSAVPLYIRTHRKLLVHSKCLVGTNRCINPNIITLVCNQIPRDGICFLSNNFQQ